MYSEQFLNKTISNLGYSDINSFAVQHVKLLLLSKIEEYSNLVNKYKNKYKMSFVEFSNKYLEKDNFEDFDIEDDGLEWRFFSESLQNYKSDYKTLVDA